MSTVLRTVPILLMKADVLRMLDRNLILRNQQIVLRHDQFVERVMEHVITDIPIQAMSPSSHETGRFDGNDNYLIILILLKKTLDERLLEKESEYVSTAMIQYCVERQNI